MNTQVIKIHTGKILEEEPMLTLGELCRSAKQPAETLIKLVDYGVINPSQGDTARQWRFQRSALMKTHKALRLKDDLGINLAGIALVMDLLDEIHDLRNQLTIFES